MKTYKIHDNCGRPFSVSIEDRIVIISKVDGDGDKYTKFVTYRPKRIFIGTSEKNNTTNFGGYGEEYDGNSILLHIRKRNYVFIGESIYMFKSIHPIISFFSPVENINDVSYPYAIDNHRYVYLFG